MIIATKAGTVGFDEAGAGLPMLLLHGFPHDRSFWAAQLAAPPEGVRLIAPDLPGFGESQRVDVPSLDAWADWAMAFCDALGLDHVVVGGLSMGGYLTFAIWRRHPERVTALVLADTKAGADSAEGKAKRLEMQALAAAHGAGAVAEKMLPGMVGKTTRETRPTAVALLDEMMRACSVEAITDALDAMRTRDDSTPTLATILVPTLIICGAEDALTPVAESEAMHKAIAKSQLAVIPGAGHASCVEHPAAFNALLSGFITASVR
ncbi:MAG: alpha/beta fold hydrolase [Gemmatimonadaceae bacterium]